MALATVNPNALQARTLHTVESLDQIGPVWTLLQTRSSDASVFSTWQWNRAAAHHFWAPHAPHVTLVEAEGGPVALFPLARRRLIGLRGLVFLGAGPFDYGRADYQDALIENGWERPACEAFVQHLRNEERAWELVLLQDIPASSRSLPLLPVLARQQGWITVQVPDNDVYWVPLPGTWEEYAATLSANVRSSLGRKQRKLERERGARFERVEKAGELGEAMQALFRLHNHRWQEKQGSAEAETIFSRDDTRRFHLEVAAELLDAGMLNLTLVRAADDVVGARYSFEFNGSRSFYASGYRTDGDWGRFSLGAVMDLQSIQDSIGRGLRFEDLLRNEGEYKARYAPVRSDTQRLLIFRTRAAYLRYQIYARARRVARRIVRRHHAE